MTNNYKEQAKKIAEGLTRQEKAFLVTGKDYWNTQDIAGLKGVCMSDGPAGLRKQIGKADYTGIQPSLPSVCYPSACLSACSFDSEITYEIGKAMAQEARVQQVDVILAPGINHKRVPWCGRNFEYFSEDPVLSAAMGSGMVEGIQSENVMSCIKHFACNNQENYRMTSDSVVSKRAFHEIYAKPFRLIIEKSQPDLIMNAYNKINGVYASENPYLAQLLKEWGFQGTIVTDWGSLNDPLASFSSATDLEMPGLSKGSDKIVEKQLDDERLTEIASHIIELMLKAKDIRSAQESPESIERHLAVSLKAAEESAVLLKNENHVLPINKKSNIALIGNLAKKPRIQGAGSSKVNALFSDSLYEVFKEKNIPFEYAQGYLENGSTSKELLEQARKTAGEKDVVVVAAGLPEIYESEGYDRDHLLLPSGQIDLIDAVSKVNKNIVVVLQCGGVCELPFLNKIKGLLLMYLAGSKQGLATYDLLYGNVNPSGKLAETWIVQEKDVPIQREGQHVLYKEDIFTGYRYYDSAKIPVNFPFGFGLSYTDFTYSDLIITQAPHFMEVSLQVENTGDVFGKEVVEIFAQYYQKKALIKPNKELIGFKKIALEPQEKKRVVFNIPYEKFAHYDEKLEAFRVEKEDIFILAGSSLEDIRLKEKVQIPGDTIAVCDNSALDIQTLIGRSDEEFLKSVSYRQSLKKEEKYDLNTTIEELKNKNRLYRWILNTIISRQLSQQDSSLNKKILERTINQMPVRLLGMYGLSKRQVESIVLILNGHWLKGTSGLFTR